jgi:hypothetical protein
MSLLTLVQDAADLCGVPRPSSVAGATDTTVRRLYALAKIEGKALMQRHQWQELITEASLTTLAAEDQGLIETIAPGFAWWIGGTIWNRTIQDQIGGPLSPQEWQSDKAQVSTGPYSQFRIRLKHLYMYPAPTAGQSVKFEYGSRYWCQSAGGTGQETWAADTDTGILSEHLMTLGVRWRYQQLNGLDYGESFRAYEIEVANAIGRDGAKRPLNLNEGDDCPPRGVRAPDGSWAL